MTAVHKNFYFMLQLIKRKQAPVTVSKIQGIEKVVTPLFGKNIIKIL